MGLLQSVILMILDKLDALRAEFSECSAIALADISSGTVLCVSTEKKQRQEHLDTLCQTAAEIFSGQTASAVSKMSEETGGSALHESVVLAKSETYVFLRSPIDPKEAMLCVCSAKLDIDSFLQQARSSMYNIATEQ